MSLDNLHDPSSAPPPPSFTPSPAPTIQSEALRLTTLKDSITSRLDIYFDVLKTNNVTMATPLVDPEGFPRADIDVAGVRTARGQINRLRNDLKAVMDEMGKLLERGLPREEAKEGEKMEVEKVEVEEGKKPFAKVDGVFPASPAAVAVSFDSLRRLRGGLEFLSSNRALQGLERGDQLISLGNVNVSNHDSLKGLAALVGQSEDVTLPLVILRADSLLHLRLTPKTGWGGRGLLGCHVVPI
ncbi:26S proteasome regulatory subunit N4, partial [Phenoliferia sp. Uapishka_3]